MNIENFWQIQLPNFCISIAITQDNQIITLREYKHGARRWGLSFPAGHLENGESPEYAMKRELREETGYVASEIFSLGSFVANANQGCGTGYLFLMVGCRKLYDPSPDLSEQIELRLMSKENVEAQIIEGEAISLPQLAVWAAANIYLKMRNINF